MNIERQMITAIKKTNNPPTYPSQEGFPKAASQFFISTPAAAPSTKNNILITRCHQPFGKKKLKAPQIVASTTKNAEAQANPLPMLIPEKGPEYVSGCSVLMIGKLATNLYISSANRSNYYDRD